MDRPGRRMIRACPLAGSLVAVLTLMCCACAPSQDADQLPVYKTRGRVLLEGNPVPNVVVIFHPKNSSDPKVVRSYARTDSEGRFTVSTYTIDDGVPAGRYVVTIMNPDGEDGANLLPPRYASLHASGLEAEIKEGVNELPPFQLRRK